MHRTLKAATARPPAANQRAQQRRFDAFRREYNEERPHQALGQGDARHAVAAVQPALSEPDTGNLSTLDTSRRGWSATPAASASRSTCCSSAKLSSRSGSASRRSEDGIWSVQFYDVLLARLDEREMTLYT